MINLIGKKVLVRGDKSGVFYGILVDKDGTEIELHTCRRIWYWSGAASISQIAAEGVFNPENCKFTMAVDSIVITDAVEIIPCTEEAQESIEGVPVWKYTKEMEKRESQQEDDQYGHPNCEEEDYPIYEDDQCPS